MARRTAPPPARQPARGGPPAEAAPRFAAERQQRIAQALREQGRVQVAQLAAAFGVSEDSVRRDLRALAARGLAQKTHGGAVALHQAVLPPAQRAAVAAPAKQAVAAAAARLVQPNDTLFIDSGSTAQALVQALCRHGAPRPLTVVTHALDVALALLDEPGITLVLAGGQWLAAERVFVGEAAQATLQAYRADIAFLAACAVHPRAGLTAHQAQEAVLKRAMLAGAARRVLLADASKLETVAPCAVAALSELDLVLCDAAPAWLKRQARVQRVQRAPAGHEKGVGQADPSQR
jgi:DeoR family glycerol-3-phosphate regulon repressor